MVGKKETTGKEDCAVEQGESFDDFPSVAIVFGADPYDKETYMGQVSVVSGEIEDLAGRDVGVFFRINDNGRHIVEAINDDEVSVIGSTVMYGRLLEQSEKGALVVPIVYRRQTGSDFSTGYEDLALVVSPEALAEGQVHVAELPDGLSDLEGGVADYALPDPKWAIMRLLGMGPMEWAFASDIGPK